MSPSLNRDYFPQEQQPVVFHKAYCLHCAVGNEQLKIIQKYSMLQRVNHSFGCNSGGGNIPGMQDLLDAAQWKDMAITVLPLRLSRACGHKTKREKQKM
jgi:hypothetical protein